MEEPTKAHSLNTNLTDRILWYDGDSSYKSDKLLYSIKKNDIKFVTEITDLVREYNKNVPTSQELHIKQQCGHLTTDWIIPDAYKKLDVIDYLFRAHATLFEGTPDFDQRERRLAKEIVLCQKYDLFDVLRAIIWIINTLESTGTVWGIGRGSSVSSYALYVIGVHDVDAFRYELDIDDFLHE